MRVLFVLSSQKYIQMGSHLRSIAVLKADYFSLIFSVAVCKNIFSAFFVCSRGGGEERHKYVVGTGAVAVSVTATHNFYGCVRTRTSSSRNM